MAAEIDRTMFRCLDKRLRFRWAIPILAAALALPGPAAAQRAGAMVEAARADFADSAKGNYFGDIVSDARGPSRSGVRIAVARIGPNRVRVSSDCARLPAFEAPLIRAMDTIRNVGGDAVFLLDLSKSPRTLMVTVDDATWAGSKE